MAWARPEGFRLLSSGIMTIIEGINVFFDVTSSYRYIRVFKLLVYLGTRAYLAVLSRHLYTWDLSLLEGPSCLIIITFYEVSVGFPYGSSRDLKEER